MLQTFSERKGFALYGKSNFAGVVKLKILKWEAILDIQVGPKYNHKCPFKNEAEGDLLPTGGDVVMGQKLKRCSHKPRNCGSRPNWRRQEELLL